MTQKILIFDYDGTIVDSLDDVFDFINKVMVRAGHSPFKTKKEFVALYEGNFYDNLRKLGLSDDDIEKYDEAHIVESQINNIDVELFPNMREVIEKLAQDNTLFIVTSGFKSHVVERLKTAGIDEYFVDVLGVEQGHSKVDKIDKIKLQYPNSELYYIGDTTGDMIEAQEAGVRTVAVTWGFHAKEQLEKRNPDIVCDKPEELLNL